MLTRSPTAKPLPALAEWGDAETSDVVTVPAPRQREVARRIDRAGGREEVAREGAHHPVGGGDLRTR